MGGDIDGITVRLFGSLVNSMRRFMFRIISVGPIPDHIAFIMDGNRRFAKKHKQEEGSGHKAGFLALMSLLKYCYELGVKYATVYAFSIDNFKRRPEEVQHVMDLMQEKIEGLLKEENIVNQYGVRVRFIGNLKLLSEPVRVAAEKAMLATANNTNIVLFICMAYTSTDEIGHSAQECCQEKWDYIRALTANRAYNSERTEENEESYQDKWDEIRASTANGAYNIERTKEKEESCQEKGNEMQALTANGAYNGEISEEKKEKHIIKLVDLERHMYMGVAPDPDILVRSSGETRLSNFLLWQTTNCLLYSPSALWPEMGLCEVVWAVLNFQRNHSYLEKNKKQL